MNWIDELVFRCPEWAPIHLSLLGPDACLFATSLSKGIEEKFHGALFGTGQSPYLPRNLQVKDSLVAGPRASCCFPPSATLAEDPHPCSPPTPRAHTHDIPQAPGHQQLLCLVLTKFKLLLKDFLALLLCYDILTHLDLRLPTWRFLAWPPWFPARVCKHGWEKILFSEVCVDYPTRSN